MKTKSTRETLLQMIEDFLQETDMKAHTFGWSAVKDRTLVERLRRGGDVTTGKLDDILKYMHNTRGLLKFAKTLKTKNGVK